VTQTGGLDVLLAWALFSAILAVLGYFLLRDRKDPMDEITAATADEWEPPGGDTGPG
jgi:hypothetical protein